MRSIPPEAAENNRRFRLSAQCLTETQAGPQDTSLLLWRAVSFAPAASGTSVPYSTSC